MLDITQIAKMTVKCNGILFQSDIGKQGQFKEGEGQQNGEGILKTDEVRKIFKKLRLEEERPLNI